MFLRVSFWPGRRCSHKEAPGALRLVLNTFIHYLESLSLSGSVLWLWTHEKGQNPHLGRQQMLAGTRSSRSPRSLRGCSRFGRQSYKTNTLLAWEPASALWYIFK